MGMLRLFSTSDFDKDDSYSDDSNVLPRADRWKKIRHKEIKEFLVIELKYSDCTNYEGRKIDEKLSNKFLL